MPDPVDPTPVKVVARGGKHYVVDKNGRALKKQAGYSTPEAAQAVASSVNATWRDAKAERKSKGGPEITEAATESRAAVVLKVVGERAKDDAESPKKKPGEQAGERMPPPPVVLPPPEPDAPVLSSALGKQMDDFVNSQPGDRVSLDGGHVLRSTKGFVSRRHGSREMKTHDTPHEAAQHLMATIQTEQHQSRLARHSERQAAQDAVADQHAAARAHHVDENFVESRHPRRGGKFVPARVRVFASDSPELHIAYDKKDKPIGHGIDDDGMVTFSQDAKKAELAHADAMKKVRAGTARLDRVEELREGKLEESIAIPHRGVPTVLHFDPRLHQRDRLGKFSEMLAKLERQPHGSMLHLPHGVAVRRSVGGLEVSGGGEEKTLRSPHAAAGEALHRHVMGEVARGADFRHESGRLLEDLDAARRGAAALDPGGAFHLDTRMAETRKERGRRLEPVTKASYRGRSNEARETFKRTHGGDVSAKVGAENLSRALAQASGHARLKTGAEIDAETRKTTAARGGGSDFPRDHDLRRFYQREYDENGNQTTGRWNEAIPRSIPNRPMVSITRAADSDRGEIDVYATDTKGRDHEGSRFEREELKDAQNQASYLAERHGVEVYDEVGGGSHRIFESPEAAAQRGKWEAWRAGKKGGRMNEAMQRLFPTWPYTKAAQSLPAPKKAK